MNTKGNWKNLQTHNHVKIQRANEQNRNTASFSKKCKLKWQEAAVCP